MEITNSAVSVPVWVFRFTAAGRADRSFGWLGMAPFPEANPFPSLIASFNRIASDSASHTVAVVPTASGKPVVYRLLANGQLDPTFGLGGRSRLGAVQLPSTYPPASTPLVVDGQARPLFAVTDGTTSAIMRLTPR